MRQQMCSECKQIYNIPVSDEQIERWKAGELIQRVMPEIGIDLRELLISGICGACFDRIFGPEDE